MEFCYTAIVLRSREIGETDRLYTLYTREGGKVQAIGRGVRKPRAKLAGHLETLNRGNVVVMRSRGLGAIASAVTDWYGVQLKADMETLSIVLDTLRIFERIVGPAERDMDIYDRLQGFLEQTEHRVSEHDPLRILLLAQAFLLQTLARLGYHLELSQSMLTGEPLMRGQRYGFSPAEGGFVEWERALHRTGLIPLQENTIKLLRLCLTHSLETLGRVRTEASVIAEVKQVVEALTRWIG